MLHEQLKAINDGIQRSYCEHADLQHEFDYSDGYPMYIGTECLDCNQDVSYLFENDDRAITELCDQEAADIQSRAIDRAVDEARGL